MKTQLTVFVVSLGMVGLSACVNPSEIEEIKANQKTILSKLEALSKGGLGRKAPPQRRAGPDASKTYAFPFKSPNTAKGPKDAWVTIVEVSDFECPFCSRVNPTLKKVSEEYGDDVRIVFTHNPLGFHKRAMPAALAAECAGDQGKFWAMHDQLFANQKALGDDELKSYAKAAGVNVGKWEACYKDGRHKAKITKDQQTAVQFGARGTPAFFINGRFLSGAQPYPNFKNLIEEELKKAKASGIAKSDYYAKAVLAKGAKKM